ncbi:MAG: FHA domain-containing protein [Acidimicrobiales bacterium]|jgi:pSer/pThr/pTyr-binding forkhead associated (FHA) protein
MAAQSTAKYFVVLGDRRVEIGPDPMIIGRRDDVTGFEPDLDVTSMDLNRHVSRRHLQIRVVDDAVEVTDLDSTSGTFVNQVSLDPQNPVLLRRNVSLLLGDLRILFEVEDVQASPIDIDEVLQEGKVVDDESAGQRVERGTIY